MEGIEFDVDGNQGLKNSPSNIIDVKKRNSFLVGLLVKIGVDDPAIANFILVGIAGLFLGVAVFLYAGILGNKETPKLSSDEIARGLKALSDMQNAQNLEK